MSSDDPSKQSAQRDAVRAKARQVRGKQRAWRITRWAALVVSAVAVVGAVAAVIVYVVIPGATPQSGTPESLAGDGVPVDDMTFLRSETTDPGEGEAETGDGTSPASGQDAPEPIDVRIYVDYLSSGAGDFERSNAEQLAEWADEGAVTITYHPVSLLSAKSNGTKYSQRAAAAAACVADHSAETFAAFNHELLTNQPKVDSDGYDDEKLAALAIAVGASDPKGVRDCIESERYVNWAKNATKRALEQPLPDTDGVKLAGAPTVLVDGEPYTGALDDPAEFAQFVLTRSSHAYYGTPTPTPTPSATPAPEEEAPAPEEPAPEEEEPAPEEG